MLDDVMPLLVGPRRRALEVALLLVEPGEVAPPDVHAIGLAVLDVVRILAERSPVLVAVDDVQWLDPASAGVLQIALRRLREESVGVLLTVRDGARSVGADRGGALFRRRAVAAAGGRSAECGCVAPSAQGPCRTRSVPTRVAPPARDHGGEPVLCRGVGTRVRAHRRRVRRRPQRCGCLQACRSCSVLGSPACRPTRGTCCSRLRRWPDRRWR